MRCWLVSTLTGQGNCNRQNQDCSRGRMRLKELDRIEMIYYCRLVQLDSVPAWGMSGHITC